MTTIKIDEFSTGIKAAGNVENWYSQGFTGEYMNRTIAEIPAAVQQAISNRLFALGEGGSSEQATLIGREVVDDEQNKAWSVLAVVTRGRDEWQRSFSASRYFICEGRGNLANLFRFWDVDKLTFNPFDAKNIGDSADYMPVTGGIDPQRLSDLREEYCQQKSPVIFPYDVSICPIIADFIANIKATEDSDPVAWAYRVEALEHPRTFKAIFPASEQAEQILRRVVASQPQVDRFVQDEPAIKKAISLLSQNKVKPEHLKTIEDALANPAIDYKYWLTMFDSQGASTAIKESSYSPQLVRLLTLRAMVIPQTLPQFFDWLNKKDKKDQIWTDCLDFQAKVTKNLSTLPNLQATILSGVRFMAVKLLDSETYLENTAWLCIADGGCWANLYKNSFRQDLKNKLENLNSQILSSSSIKPDQWDSVFGKLLEYLRTRKHYLFKEYFILANLFFMTGDYKLAAIFCHVSAGEIPPELFKKLNSNHPDHANVYGIRVYRKIGTAEKIGGFIMPVYLFTPLLIIAILSSAFITYFGASRWFKPKPYVSSLEIISLEIMKQEPIKKSQKIKEITDAQKKREVVNKALAVVLADGFKYDSQNTKIEQLSCKVAKQIDPNEYCVDIGNNSATSKTKNPPPITDQDINLNNQESFNAIVKQVKNKLNVDSQKGGENTIKNQILEIFKQYDSTIPSFEYLATINPGEDVIKKYQISKSLDNNGKIDQDGKTFEALKCDVAKKLTKYLTSPISGCSN